MTLDRFRPLLIGGVLLVGGLAVPLASAPGFGVLRIQTLPGAQTAAVPGARVHALFDLSRPDGSPFPSDRFTIADRSHNTQRRVALPHPDCAVRVSDCQDVDVINTLDGFGLQTRLSIPFDGHLDPATVTATTIFVVRLASTRPSDERGGRTIGINQVVWDPETFTVHAEVNELLDQHRRYALIVTDGLRDRFGWPIQAAIAFRQFTDERHVGAYAPAVQEYRKALLEAVRVSGIPANRVVAASTFTTMSITPVMERIRDQIKAATPKPANFLLGPTRERAVFSRTDVVRIAWSQHTNQNPTGFTSTNVILPVLDVVPGAIGTIAHGVYASPDYRVHPGEYIPAVGTLTGTPTVQRYDDIYFSLFLPAGPKPAAGWPIALVGHGSGGNRHAAASFVASTLASYGIATIGITGPGYGFGPQGTLTVILAGGRSLVIPDGGRGVDQDGNGVLGNGEGSAAAPPRAWTIGERDGVRQHVIDLLQLVRVIEVGMDVDGDGARDLDPARIYYQGHSGGATVGTMLLALEPSFSAAVISSPGALYPEQGRWAPGRRARLGEELKARTPSLINSPGITHIDGIEMYGPLFDENKPRRGEPPLTNSIQGAIQIQDAFEIVEWGHQESQTLVWIPYVRKSPLRGVSPKPLIYQFSKGDQQATALTTTAILRAGNLADRTVHYRHDLAVAEDPKMVKNSHNTVGAVINPSALFREIARGLQEQIGTFFASNGKTVIHPEPSRFFEVPARMPLAEELNYIPGFP